MRYELDFGSANAGGSPTFDVFVNTDTGAPLTPPAFVERSQGLFYFDWPWATGATTITYKASLNGIELSDVIRSDASSVAGGTATAGTGAALQPWLWTAGQIINTVAVEVGLSEVVDPYSSTDANFIRLRTLLKTAGQELIGLRDWKTLVRECTLTGDGTTSLFNLPADFLRMVDQSGWNRTSRRPLGLVSSQEWQYLKARTFAATLTVLYRLVQGRLQFNSAPVTGTAIVFDYVSRFWAMSSGAAAADLYQPASAGDVVMFEPLMVSRLLKVKWLQASSLDSSGALAEYQDAYEIAAGNEPAPVLSLSGSGSVGVPLIGAWSLPDTGYGS